MKEKIYKSSPVFIQNLLISVFNILEYKKRYSGVYKNKLVLFKKNNEMTLEELLKVQKERYADFLNYVNDNSEYFNDVFSSIKDYSNIASIKELPIIDKEKLRQRIDSIKTFNSNKKYIISKTGGTTGKSLEVLYEFEDMQERFACLDNFRGKHGYKLGKKTAWFSGKDLLTKRDVKKRVFWKTDNFYNVRYYSTFHINNEYLSSYIQNLIDFKPLFLVGFPSTMNEIAKFGLANGIDFPRDVIKAVFPTAETITEEVRNNIQQFFKTKMFNQYASSEGAPFIFECAKGNLHLELQSGVFEVLDVNNNPAQSGRLVITSFTTKGTPLIRYDIGDSITLCDEKEHCSCGNNNPLVKEILGRVDDFIYSPENGKINLGNVSNTLKDTKGIIRFQVLQNELNRIEILLEIDKEIFNKNIENKFLQNWYDRVGNNMEINLIYVSDIEVEKSGKFRIVKNNIKHLI
ncbi:phenylacetate--CoA ligase family protein [Myroides odoratimimus]|uniref:phenylacetate--CoA ligase family protein n=1 Tax=Myroides odoratimimus TaxID=76832 RepID=UPI0031016319